MMYRLATAVLLLCGATPFLSAQVSTQARQLAATITPGELREHLYVIAADSMEGRETGQPGQRRAADYLRRQVMDLGLPPVGDDGGYYQKIRFSRQRWDTLALTFDGEPLDHLRDYYSAPSRNDSRPTVDIEELIFLGYGIDDPAYSDYARAEDLNGKSILIIGGEPRHRNGNFRLTGSKDPSDWSLDDGRKLRLARQRGVSTVIIIDPAFRKNVDAVRRETLDGRLRMREQTEAERREANHVYISPATARRLLGKRFRKVVSARRRIEGRGRPAKLSIPTDLSLTQQKEVRELTGHNVLGYVEGSDPALNNQVVVVSAHYDHLGRRGEAIFNGADDNGSGSSTLLELAEATVAARRRGLGPRRSVLFLWVSGEEKGLLGSEYYATHPVFPLEQTVADINVDMIGRVDEKHAGNPHYVYVIGSDRLSTELHEIIETANREHAGLELDYQYNERDDPNRYYERSDHYNFAERGVPSVFFFSGTHEDYHRPTDTADKIDFEKTARIGRLIFHTLWQLANQDRRIVVDVEP